MIFTVQDDSDDVFILTGSVGRGTRNVSALKSQLKTCMYRFCFHLGGQNFVTWPHAASRETENGLLFFPMEKIKWKFWDSVLK